MDKSKGKKKSIKGGGARSSKKKITTKKAEKSSKKKKTSKKNGKEDQNPDIEVIEQKEKNEEGENTVSLQDKLNQPLNKKKLPPIEKNNENEEEKEINEEDIKNEEINNENINIEKEPIEYKDSSVGTPFFYDISGLKSDVEEQNKKINEANISQEKYKISLNNLLNDLNKILSENVEVLYSEGEDPKQKQKQENILYLQNILFQYQQQIKDVKEKNKLYKQHYELLMKQDEVRVHQSAKEYEALIEEKKNDNNNLNKKIS